MASEAAATPLVGRVAELRALADLVGEGASGRPAPAVLLGGDAGAGKSRLLAELCNQVRDQRWQVLVGHCLDLGEGAAPYLPLSEALGRLASDEPDVVAALLASHPPLAALLPERRSPGPAEAAAPSTERSVLYDAIHAALTDLGRAGPVLFVIEDVHWADQSTRDLLRFLFTRRIEAPVSIVASYRSDDLHRRHPLRAALAEWVRVPGVSRLVVGPLSDDDARDLVRALHGGPVEDEELRQILLRAEGNPFFIEELVAAVVSTAGRLPADLADLLLVRLEQLDDDGRLVVRAASVAGREVSHPLLAHGTALGPAALETALRAAVDANILVALGNDAYGFRHALLAEAVYQDLLPGERVRLHAAYADALAAHRAEGSAAELAHHARASHDLVTAALASVEAGDAAMAMGGPEEATRHYELALELLSDPAVAAAVGAADSSDQIDRISLVVRASRAAAAAGHMARAVALADDTLRSLPPDAPPLERVRLIQALVTTALVIDSRVDIIGLTTEAVRLLGDEPPSALRASMLTLHARACATWRAREDDAGRWAVEALAMARDLNLPDVATDATILLARLDERAGDPDRAQASIEAAIAQAEAAGVPHAKMRGRNVLASLHYSQGRIREALDGYAETAREARALGRQWAPYGLDSVVFAAIAACTAGDWELAEALTDLRNQSPPELAEALLSAVRLELAAWRGEVGALSELPRVRARWQLDGLVAITSGGAAIELYAQQGDVARAVAVHDDAVATVRELWQRPTFLAEVRLAGLLLGHLATAAGRASGSERSELVARGDDLAEHAMSVAESARHPGAESIAWADRLSAERARLRWLAGGGPDRGIDAAGLAAAWRATVAGFERFGHVPETARSRARLAAVLLAAGEQGDAAEAASVARVTAEKLGARPLLEELRALPGSEPAVRRTARETEALTTREHEVLTLVATGRSNREIAAQLFISAKTVSVHISNVMAKLDAASRTEAVAVARRLGLLT